MNHSMRLIVASGLIAFTVLFAALGLARNHVDILTPLHLLLFLFGVAFYLLPTGLALYQNRRSTLWIAAVNVLLGWTLFGWFVAIGWAAGGETEGAAHALAIPHAQPNSRD